MAKERLTAYFSGRVQGVGFRWHTQHLAAGHEVAGYVKNLADGRVELVAEGEVEELDRFLLAIKNSRLRANIQSVDEKRSRPTGQFTGFGIEDTD